MSSWPDTVLEVQSALPFIKREDQFKEKFGMLMQSAIGNGLVLTLLRASTWTRKDKSPPQV